jgi:hypothetical protein
MIRWSPAIALFVAASSVCLAAAAPPPFAVDRSPYYAHRAYQMDTMAVGPDGAIFCGENDRGGKLFIYQPGPGPFREGLNPTNAEMERQRADTPGLIPERL